MYECWAWIDGDWVKGWDVGDTAFRIGIKFRREDCIKDVYEIDSWRIDYSRHFKHKPNYTPKEVDNAK